MKVKKISFIHSEECATDFPTSENTTLDLKSHVTSDPIIDSVEHFSSETNVRSTYDNCDRVGQDTDCKQFGTVSLTAQEKASYFKALSDDGLYLQYIEEQTPEICLAAVQQNGLAIKFVERQTLDICLAAVKQCGVSLQYIREPTEKICIAAVRKDRSALKYVDAGMIDLYSESIQ